MTFKVWQSSKDKLFYWVLIAGNGEVIAQSEGYVAKQSAKKGIRAVKRCFFAKVIEL